MESKLEKRRGRNKDGRGTRLKGEGSGAEE